MIDEAQVNRLLEKSREKDLALLAKTRVALQQDLARDYSLSKLRMLEKLDRRLEELKTGQRIFRNRQEVLVYLKEQGYKVSKSKLYGDVKKGLLKVERDGSVTMDAVKSYIAHPLAHLSDGSEYEVAEKLALERLAADTERVKAQAEHWHIKNLREKGLLVWRSEFERALANRAIRLKEDLRNFAYGEAPEIIRIVSGDTGKTSELMTYLLDRVEEFLGRYAEEREMGRG